MIDSGIDLDHADLNVDASRGFNAFTSGKDGRSADDGNGHGTHVAGTIAAINNDIGVIGVAPGATVIPVKVLDSRGSGSYSGVIAGVDHVAAYGNSGDVANMSLGGPTSDALDQAVLSASQQGIKFVLAAGNESSDANNSSPARVNGSNIYTISAMDSNDNWASFSNYGNPPVDYAAPGVAVKSTWKSGGYNTISGTSMAAPHAAGVLLLGNASTDGTVNGDPDGNPDPIIVH
ncbi:S8 family serine peptidase [Salegentibacter sp. HM20]